MPYISFSILLFFFHLMFYRLQFSIGWLHWLFFLFQRHSWHLFLHSSTCRIEIDETTVSGSFNMIFLQHSIALGYRNHTNIIMRYPGIWIIGIGLIIIVLKFDDQNWTSIVLAITVVLFCFNLFPRSLWNLCLEMILFLTSKICYLILEVVHTLCGNV